MCWGSGAPLLPDSTTERNWSFWAFQTLKAELSGLGANIHSGDVLKAKSDYLHLLFGDRLAVVGLP